MKKRYDIAVVGGGAAGLAAAVTAAGRGRSALLLEKEKRVGKKLLATGNGRCNYTNTAASVRDYRGGDPAFAAAALERFGPAATTAFFHDLGVLPYEEEEGRVYPLSRQAAAVLDALRFAADRRGVETRTETRVTAIVPERGLFRLEAGEAAFAAKKVIIACGGMAGPELGGCRDGYGLLAALGHPVTDIAPSLVKIRTENRLTRPMKGVRVLGRAVLKKRGEAVSETAGEFLFTDYGVSGIPVMQLSRSLCFDEPTAFALELDLLPAFSPADLADELKKRRADLAAAPTEDFLIGMVPKKVGQVLLREALGKRGGVAGDLTDDEILALAETLKRFSLPVTGVLGWKEAQVTAGGAETSFFDGATMESRLVPGLYAAGEVLDIDGGCGGYNLQWAWASGRLAAEAAVSALEKKDDSN